MKLFLVTSVFNGACPPLHVHATNSREAHEIAYRQHGRPYAMQVYDISQDAMVPGALDLDECPMDTFRA